MRLHSLKLKNFRSFYGNQEISFSVDDEKNTTFVWADNAVGKTNLLNAITWCLYEEFTPNFKRKDDLLNHQAATEGQAAFSVEVVFEEGAKIYRALRTGGLNKGFTLHQQSEYGDYSLMNNPTIVINSVLPKDMMKYFFIDGEGAPVAVSTSGEISAENSIKDILGFKVAEKALVDLNSIKAEHRRELTSFEVSDDLKIAQRKFENILREEEESQKRVISLRNALKIIQEDFLQVEQYLEGTNNTYVQELSAQRSNLEIDIRRHEKLLEAIHNEKRQLVRNYAWSAFASNLSAEAINFIDESQYRGTIPAPYNESLIQDIIKESKCICGSEITPGSQALENIQKLLQKAANPVIYGRIQRARSFLQVAVENSKKAPDEIKSILNRVAIEEQALKSKKQQAEEISKKLGSINVEEIAKAEAERKRLVVERDRTNRQIGALDERFKEIVKEKEKLDRKIKALSSNLPHAKIIQKRIAFIDKVIEKINSELERSLENIKPLLTAEMSAFISASMPNNISVGITEDFKVGLYNEIDGKKRLVAPSGGLTAILTLIYTSTLVQIAKIRSRATGNILTAGAIAPLVLDAPFSHVSETYAPKLAEALAEKSEQLIVFLFDKSAKGGEKVIRDKGKCGKEYYLLQETSEPQGNKPLKTIKVNEREYPVVKYDSDVNTVRIMEAN